ncbi:putative B3 domain-containing protein At1g78640 isoform X1 [Camellia sinensis]|uniref:putative B3 domain-containing protein At1g78640 isoform X1 n=2 Tax=Camellia sinensis TaxID=4442 RepID=UPI0010355CDF|nr:putative B3 domain-containing protein At1g78640 isoform X1 [Camellia sinensis]
MSSGPSHKVVNPVVFGGLSNQSAMRRTTYHNVSSRGHDLWPIRKALTLSDVDITHPFLTLPRQPVEDHIVVHLTPQDRDHLRNVEHVSVNAQDDDTGGMYVMKLKWRGSYYNLIGKWGKIVRGKGLDVGREIKIRWANGCLHFSVSPQQNVVIPQMQIVAAPQEPQQWPITKVLTLSDVDINHPFLPLPRRPVEDHILVYLTPQERELLRNEEQVNVNALDYDTGELYVMKLKWRGNYYNLIGKWGKIIRRKGLGVGKEIKIRWANKCLHFSVPQEQNSAAPVVLDQWPIKKALTLSDVDTNHPFLTLPGKSVEDHILLHWTQQTREKLRNERQLNIDAQDFDTGDFYAMKLRWRGSYYNLIGKWGKIIRGKRLSVGKEIRVCWDNGFLLFSVPQ